jgi:hypothetical protein
MGKEESDIFAILPCRLLHLPSKKPLKNKRFFHYLIDKRIPISSLATVINGGGSGLFILVFLLI